MEINGPTETPWITVQSRKEKSNTCKIEQALQELAQRTIWSRKDVPSSITFQQGTFTLSPELRMGIAGERDKGHQLTLEQLIKSLRKIAKTIFTKPTEKYDYHFNDHDRIVYNYKSGNQILLIQINRFKDTGVVCASNAYFLARNVLKLKHGFSDTLIDHLNR